MGKTFSTGLLTNGIWQDASNNIGIGAAPSGSYKLEVTGTGRFTNSVTGTTWVGNANYTFASYYNAASTLVGTLGTIGAQTGSGVFTDFAIVTLANFAIFTGNSLTPSMYINSSKNVGIGTSSPAEKLHIQSSSSGGKNLLMQTSIAAGRNYMQFANGSGDMGYFGYGGADGKFYINNQLNDDMLFYTNSTERMRITSGGTVSINASSPSGDALYVQAKTALWAARFDSAAVTSSSFGVVINAGTNSADNAFYVRSFNAGSIYMNIRGDGFLSSPPTYINTTANAANMWIGSDGFFGRSTSSLKYKKDVRHYDKGLTEVMLMRSVYYKGKGDNDGDTQFAGLIAEEIHDLGLTEFVQYAEDGSPDALAYSNMVALLVKAIQELNEKLIRNNIN
jgi:hypothetical protein